MNNETFSKAVQTAAQKIRSQDAGCACNFFDGTHFFETEYFRASVTKKMDGDEIVGVQIVLHGAPKGIEIGMGMDEAEASARVTKKVLAAMRWLQRQF